MHKGLTLNRRITILGNLCILISPKWQERMLCLSFKKDETLKNSRKWIKIIRAQHIGATLIWKVLLFEVFLNLPFFCFLCLRNKLIIAFFPPIPSILNQHSFWFLFLRINKGKYYCFLISMRLQEYRGLIIFHLERIGRKVIIFWILSYSFLQEE